MGQELVDAWNRVSLYRSHCPALVRRKWRRIKVLCVVRRVRNEIFRSSLDTLTRKLLSVMSCLYCLWDILDDLVFRKAYESDASKFAKLCGSCMSSRVWGVIWFLISLVFFIAGILIGLAAFKGWYGIQS